MASDPPTRGKFFEPQVLPLATIALVLGILSIVPATDGHFTASESIVSIIAIVFGHFALHRAKHPEHRSVAQIGLVLGYISMLLWLVIA
ncbi:MAG: DUF4190 domain-containing protein [Verrucomicrobiae bacterium]|nr:DUF4190 domain-containing protein [Verrucomicrobiae bacterium]